MPRKADWEAAFAICAAIIGAGFASGREIVGFFSGLGSASWLGVASAGAAIAGLIYLLMLLSGRARSETFHGLYGALMGPSCQDAIGLLHGLLCLITASAMLAAGAELGALILPCRHSAAIGFALTLCAALISTISGFRALAYLGFVLIPLVGLFYLRMGMDGVYRPPFDASLLPAAMPMGLLYASFNTALAGSAVCTAGARGASARAVSALTGGIMLVLLASANRAMLRAGDPVRQMALPSVALSARWGLAGYYAAALVMWLSVLTTLCAMLQSLLHHAEPLHLPRSASLAACAVAASLPAVCGFRLLVDTLYPLLGWVCAFALLALIFFLPDAEGRTKSSGSPFRPE